MIRRNISSVGLTLGMTAMLAELRRLAAGAPSLESLQQSIAETVAQDLPHYNWTGFYMLDASDQQTLILGPFVGAPTVHVRIPVSQGICGAAVASGETVIVDHVHSDPRYLSCSVETKSEIVVPIHVEGKVIGEVDIDSHDPAVFTNADRAFLEEVARIVGRYVEEHERGFVAEK